MVTVCLLLLFKSPNNCNCIFSHHCIFLLCFHFYFKALLILSQIYFLIKYFDLCMNRIEINKSLEIVKTESKIHLNVDLTNKSKKVASHRIA